MDQFADPDFRDALVHTLIYTLIAVPGSVVCSLLLALAVNHVKGKTFYRTIFFLPTITSSVAVSMVWLWMLNGDFGMINSTCGNGSRSIRPTGWWIPPGSSRPWRWSRSGPGVGFNMIIFLAGLQGIPATYLEAAQIDGASKWRQFWNITLPLLSPTTFFVTIISIIASFQVFDMIYVMTGGGPGSASTTMVFHIYELAFVNFTFGMSAAAAVVLFAIIMGVTLVPVLGPAAVGALRRLSSSTHGARRGRVNGAKPWPPRPRQSQLRSRHTDSSAAPESRAHLWAASSFTWC